ncbi:unnamed protein product, partial [Didymodactylos carnosus]
KYGNRNLPLLTFVLVKKRHHTRLFMHEHKIIYEDDTMYEVGITSNVPCGLVVDTKIISPWQSNFVINLHEAIEGTNKVLLYHVLHDEIGFTAEELRKIIHSLCYSDPRSSTSEAIPSVVYIADYIANYIASKTRYLFPHNGDR